jgi:hypothetical protein
LRCGNCFWRFAEAKRHAGYTLTTGLPGVLAVRAQGIGGAGPPQVASVAPHSGGTEPPQSPVFCGAKNAPKY